MKHLKKYNEEIKMSDDEITTNIKDILLELTDVGFIVRTDLRNILKMDLTKKPHIVIKKRKLGNFKFDEVSDVIDRLRDFMKINGIGMVYDNFTKTYNSDKIEYINIHFFKNK
jgi:hypothetical protein